MCCIATFSLKVSDVSDAIGGGEAIIQRTNISLGIPTPMPIKILNLQRLGPKKGVAEDQDGFQITVQK